MLQSEGLKGAIVYYDGQMNDTRMALAAILTATQSGAATGLPRPHRPAPPPAPTKVPILYPRRAVAQAP